MRCSGELPPLGGKKPRSQLFFLLSCASLWPFPASSHTSLAVIRVGRRLDMGVLTRHAFGSFKSRERRWPPPPRRADIHTSQTPPRWRRGKVEKAAFRQLFDETPFFFSVAAGGSHRLSPKRAQMLAYSYNSFSKKTFGGITLSFFSSGPWRIHFLRAASHLLMNNPQAVRSKLTIATVCSDVAQGKSGGLIFGCVVLHVVQWQDGSLLVFAGSIPVRADAGSIPDVEILFPFSSHGGGRVKPVAPKDSECVVLITCALECVETIH